MSEENGKKRNQGNNDFPVCVYPGKVQAILKELQEERLYPLEFIGSALLFVVSILIGAGSWLMDILGKTYANVYIAIVGDQGTNKSTPTEYLILPLLEADNAAITEYNAEVAEWNAKEQKYRTTHVDDDNPGPFPRCKRLICNDTTPEVTLKLLAENPMGIGHYQDELSSLFSCFSRYNKDDKNEKILLNLYSGKPITVDRATRKEIMSVLRPYYSIIGTIQPKCYITLMAKNERFDSGLFSRFITATMLDNPPLKWSLNEDLPSDVDERYRELIKKLISRRRATEDNPVEYKLTSDADYAIKSWQNNHEDNILIYGRDTDRAVFRKSQLYVVKFALILQVLWDCVENKDNPEHLITHKTAIYATMLADHFYHNAKEIARSVSKTTLTATEKNVYEALPDRFTSVEGIEIARRMGLGKTCFYGMVNKIKGILLEQPSHGLYIKKMTAKVVKV